jgi:LysR family glycine cleavage system transcriptional activator
MDVGIRYGDGRRPDLKSTFLLRDAFFPVCSPALLEGIHLLRGPKDLRHHTLIHDRSMASESAFPGLALPCSGCEDPWSSRVSRTLISNADLTYKFQ